MKKNEKKSKVYLVLAYFYNAPIHWIYESCRIIYDHNTLSYSVLICKALRLLA